MVAYYPDSCTVDVQPVVQRQIPTDDDDTLVAEPIPQVTNVPVLFPQGGGFRITWPINPGDTVLLVPLMLSHTAWRQGMANGDIADQGKHHIANCIAIPSMVPDVSASPADPTSLVIEGTDIRIGGADATDFAALSSKVDTELQNLATSLTTGIAGGNPVTFGTPYTPSGSVAASSVKVK